MGIDAPNMPYLVMAQTKTFLQGLADGRLTCGLFGRQTANDASPLIWDLLLHRDPLIPLYADHHSLRNCWKPAALKMRACIKHLSRGMNCLMHNESFSQSKESP